MFYYYYDWTYILVVIGAVICIAASARVKNVFSRYSRIQSHSGLTGREAAEQILHPGDPHRRESDGPLQSGQ